MVVDGKRAVEGDKGAFVLVGKQVPAGRRASCPDTP